MPVVGHQEVDALPASVDKWFAMGRQDDAHLAKRVDRYLGELLADGLLDRIHPEPRLSYDGGQVVLRLMRAEASEIT